MAFATLDGLRTRYEIVGDGPPLLMYAPGGFDATIEKWSTQGIYRTIDPVAHLSRRYRCILFDRRECGQSGGRVERVTFAHYVAQGLALLDHLGVECAHLMGGCMGCAPVAAFGAAHPRRVKSMILFWPVGGAKYRIAEPSCASPSISTFVQQHGLAAVVELIAQGPGKPFGADPRGGPWASA